ncbi:sugar transferase [Salinarchaeum chitinilyticum]
MRTGWQYRVASAAGAVALTVAAVLLANQPPVQELFTSYVPLFNRLNATVLDRDSLRWAVPLSAATVATSLIPLYKPRPRRILDTVIFAQKRVIVAGLALATIGYFQWSHRLPRATLVMTVAILCVTIPLWFVWIRNRPTDEPGRTIVVGDDPDQIRTIVGAVDDPIIGYLCPEIVAFDTDGTVADGGVAAAESTVPDAAASAGTPAGALPRLGGLARIEDVLVEQDVDTVVLAFDNADRAEFFGALDACYEHGVGAKVHRDYADSVLVGTDAVGEVVDVDITPWDPQDHLFKRTFDVCFSAVGLFFAAPVMALIALGVKLDSDGPVLYSQERTAVFGEPFSIYKFRTMVPEGETAEPTEEDENDRITRFGRLLRRTHLDEIPQLWSILVGDMSVVGPRAVWTEEELLLEEDSPSWRKRWFVKPGLTGLAQINDVKSTDPNTKLRYDLEYIRRQSFWFDVKIVVRQVWKVLIDVNRAVRSGE